VWFSSLLQLVVVRAANPMAGSMPIGSGQWNTGLFGCFEDGKSCICSWCCPCIVVGQLVEIVDQGVTTCLTGGAIFFLLQSLTGCGCFYTCGFRARLRSKYGLPPEPCGDYCVDCCCLCCSLAQQYRELSSRGIQADLGWEANRTAYQQSAPPQQQKMDAYQ